MQDFTLKGFWLFDPETEFISSYAASTTGVIISAVLLIPLLLRVLKLSGLERGKLTINGQLATITANLTATLYLTWCFINSDKFSPIDMLIVAVGYVAAGLHHIQDGRVTICSGVLFFYWFGMIVVHLCLALSYYLEGKHTANWILYLTSLSAMATFQLELNNRSRSPNTGGIVSFDDSSVFSKISFSLVNELIEKGSKVDLSYTDFPHLPAGLNAVNNYTKLQNELNKLSVTGKYRILLAIFMMFSRKLALLTLLNVISETANYIQPSLLGLFLGSLSSYIQGKSPLFVCYYFATIIGIAPLITTSLSNTVSLITSHLSIAIRVSLISAIYRKALTLSPGAQEKIEISKIMNLISVDASQVISMVQVLPTLISAPIGLVVSIWQLWIFLGPSIFSAIALYAIVIPMSGFLSTTLGKNIPRQMAAKDKRSKLTSNLFRNIKSLKLYSWEKPFFECIKEVREILELHTTREIATMQTALMIIWYMMGDIIAAAVFVTFLYLKVGTLSPEIIFPSMLLLQYATMPFMSLPMAITSLLRCITSQSRINELLTENDQDYMNYYKTTEPSNGYEEPAVVANNATISWNGENTESKIALKNVSFSATRGDLVCVIGHVGAGKTALLKALGGELAILGGDITVKGSLAYCTQEAWLQNQTLRNNILFGQKFQKEWYEKVIEACELTSDIAQMPKGDQTDVGERGISLSGGQKARVALARAVFTRADIFLLDDVLSAVDEHVSAKLIKNLFGSRGLLGNRTIILATNNVKVLSHSSLIVALENKQVVAADSFAEVVRKRGESKIYRLIEEFGHADDLKQEADHVEDRKATIIELEKYHMEVYPSKLQQIPLKITTENFSLSNVNDEEEEKGIVSLIILKRYFGTLKPWYTIFFCVALLLSTIITSGTNIYLGFLSNQALDTLYDARWYIVCYLVIVVLSSIGIFVTSVWCEIVMGLKVSKRLHNSMLWSLMHAPMSFFDVTPLGRLMNRFAGDIASLDDRLPTMIYYTSSSFLNVVLNLAMIAYGGPVVCTVIVPLVYLGNKYRRIYVPSSRKVSRMASAADSPILSHIEESLKGQALLRTFDRTTQFIEIYEERIDYWLRISFTQYNLSLWLKFRMQAMSAILMMASAASSTYLIGEGLTSIGYGAAILHFASRTGVMVRQTFDFLAQIEVSNVSLNRVLEYVDIKQEAPSHIEATEPSKLWPEIGNVSFQELSARYTPDGNDVLKNLSFNINGGEKIGIVGRTGSGKSSLTMAIFRILEAHSGHIEIDGVDISKLGLFDLRSRLAIIPQDAQIFDASLRENLDPLNTVDDARLWEVLELCHLKEFFKAQELGLDTSLKDGGYNLSRGQAQLVCLGRALIHKAKVLVLDEATASVDVETDKIIQDTIRKNFNGRTIITIAHRLNTILDSDRIIVLEDGEIKEFDTPQNLLNSFGLFYSLFHGEEALERSN